LIFRVEPFKLSPAAALNGESGKTGDFPPRPARLSLEPVRMNVDEGQKAPAFTLTATDGKKVSLKDFAGKNVVLYFYPKDMTSGCTQEACDFRDASAALKKLGAVVLGVSPDPVKRHVKFTEQEGLNFPLLADEDHAVCEKYGVWAQKSMYGRKYWGVERSTFLIDKTGRIAALWRKVKVPGHVEEVIAALKDLRG
jgi:peroxiredoxin Q/BCP